MWLQQKSVRRQRRKPQFLRDVEYPLILIFFSPQIEKIENLEVF